ncbi:heat-inducible transcriptional repressor HrcA [Kocuria coralli]|uniref:Heat-inducible transcription repressor HrcA n=1 Tax=Kocuria coralli TaxID=1461025 RepID=A0A5J5L1S3_9MICC|nr:heat-inducible transcriptional repressor HrcA [Kocuria coralli]KAA9395036.1 heat-inducible transcriptional repressor HrcA [Kocuria coralli]
MDHPRRLQVLQAIVDDYVHSREPVGSQALVERHKLGVSSATVRNDMGALEDAGLIMAPHTSAGRIPTEKGYRTFVDQITSLKPLSAPERRAIRTLLEGAEDIDDVMERTVRLLAQLTHQVAVVQYPTVKATTVRHVELVRMDEHQVLVVLIPTDGRVAQRVITLGEPTSEASVLDARLRILASVTGRSVVQAIPAISAAALEAPSAERPIMLAVAEALQGLAAISSEQRMVMAGTANLANATRDFARTIGPVLEALEEQVALLRLLSEMQQDERGIAVRIGAEDASDPLVETAVVATGYGPQESAKLGVLGPTRMDYPSTMAAVRAVARYLSRVLGP